MVITIGDIITLSFLKENLQPSISMFDLKTRRNMLKQKETELLSSLKSTVFVNKPGTINTTIASRLKKETNNYLLKKTSQTIFVKGEEDLLTLPAILLAPLNSLIFYGQYDLGAIMVKVTEGKKVFVKELLNKFN